MEFPQFVCFGFEHLHLLIERQQTSHQIQVALFLNDAFLQIINAVVFSVTVVVEILIGIVHDDGFSVFLHQCTLILGFLSVAGSVGIQRLLEGCGVFKCEAFC